MLFVSLPAAAFSQSATDLLGILEARDFERLESTTKMIQLKFEKGEVTEIELRNAYRPFYNLDGETLNKVSEWKYKFTDSYAARLIRGIHFKKRGAAARGGKYISQTPRENLEKMHQNFMIAKDELHSSLKLTQKPFLSVFHLLDISTAEGDKETSLELLLLGNKILPGNLLIRNRFINSLAPRWGGSYEEMQLFIEMSKAEGVSESGIMQLEAMMYDDMVATALERSDNRAAIDYSSKALDLGQRVGGEFSKDFLSWSNLVSCRAPILKKYCQ